MFANKHAWSYLGLASSQACNQFTAVSADSIALVSSQGLGWIGLGSGWYGLGWIGMGWIGLDWVESVWFGLGRIGSDWVGLGRIGSDWVESDLAGLERSALDIQADSTAQS